MVSLLLYSHSPSAFFFYNFGGKLISLKMLGKIRNDETSILKWFQIATREVALSLAVFFEMLDLTLKKDGEGLKRIDFQQNTRGAESLV